MKASAIVVLLVSFSGTGLAQTTQEWPVTRKQFSGNKGDCMSVANGVIQVKDDVIRFFMAGVSEQIWKVQVAADGSVDTVVPTFGNAAIGTRVIIPAGTGPRELRTLGRKNGCGYLYVPAN